MNSAFSLLCILATGLNISLTVGFGIDQYEDCGGWAARGDCDANQGFMFQYCPASCNGHHDAPQPIRVQEPKECTGWANRRECTNNPGYMLTYCANSCAKVAEKTVADDGSCADLDQYCESWAADDQCTVNPGYMLSNCRKACGVCSVAHQNLEVAESIENGGDLGAQNDAETEAGTSISALLGSLLPKAEKQNLYKEQRNG